MYMSRSLHLFETENRTQNREQSQYEFSNIFGLHWKFLVCTLHVDSGANNIIYHWVALHFWIFLPNFGIWYIEILVFEKKIDGF